MDKATLKLSPCFAVSVLAKLAGSQLQLNTKKTEKGIKVLARKANELISQNVKHPYFEMK